MNENKQELEVVYSNRVFNVLKIPKDGRLKKDFYIVERHSDSVVILPILPNGNIIIERQFRYAANTYLYEIPAGMIKKDELPLDAAKRELEEETGYKTSKISLFMQIYESPGILMYKSYMFIAENLTKGKRSLDEDELIDVEEVSLEKAISMIEDSTIKDSKTIGAILYYKLLASK